MSATCHCVELILRIVVPAIVPPTSRYPFQYWSRFEQGYSGNPHAHSILYGPFNPSFDNVVKDAETKELLENTGEVDGEDLRLWDDVTQEVTDQFKRYVSEMHPAKDSSGEALYDFVIENIRDEKFGKPQCVNLREMLDRAFANEHADVDELKRLLLALIEDGQRHTMHGYKQPTKGVQACARQKPHTTSPTQDISR